MEKGSEIRKKQQQQLVLVHGFCHGAWCWYKLVAALNSKGCRVTAIDLPAGPSSFSDFVRPLMDFLASLPDHEKVGHSYGGLSISLAMENFPAKISLAVFLTAYMPMPDSTDPPAALIHEYLRRSSRESFMGCDFTFDKDDVPVSAIFGPEYMAAKLYAPCSAEDLELAKMLIKPSLFYLEDLSNKCMVSEEKYGSVKRCYVICEDDEVMDQEFQRYKIEKSPPDEVISIPASGHMAMLTKTHHLSSSLLQLSHKCC